MIIVSGSPRSGTSLIMRLLEKLDYEIVTDDEREPDEHNPNGYYEISHIGKKIKENKDFLDQFSEKQCLKLVSLYLVGIPEHIECKVIYCQRNWHEIWRSQEKMIGRKILPSEKRQQVVADYEARKYIKNNKNITCHFVNYNSLLERNLEQLSFLDLEKNKETIQNTIDDNLYRNRLDAKSTTPA